MAARQWLALDVRRVFLPGVEYVVEGSHRPLGAPEGEDRAADADAVVCRVVLEVDGGCGPVVLAHRMQSGGVREAAQVLGEGRLGYGGGDIAAERPVAQEELGVPGEQCLRQGRWLDQEEPVEVDGGQLFRDL